MQPVLVSLTAIQKWWINIEANNVISDTLPHGVIVTTLSLLDLSDPSELFSHFSIPIQAT